MKPKLKSRPRKLTRKDKVFPVCLTDDMARAIADEAENEGVSRQVIIRQIIQHGLSPVIKANKKRRDMLA